MQVRRTSERRFAELKHIIVVGNRIGEIDIEIVNGTQESGGVALVDPASANTHENTVANFICPQTRSEGRLTGNRHENSVGVIGALIGKAPSYCKRGVDYEISHLEPSVIDVITDSPALRIGLYLLLQLQNALDSS